jgi:hypothetical protein
VLTATESISIARKPPIELLSKRAHKRNRKDPRNEAPLRESIDYVLDRRRSLKSRFVVMVDELE